MLQYSIEALDREDFEVSSMALENIAPPSKWSARSPPIDNNASPSSPANVLVDPEFARLL